MTLADAASVAVERALAEFARWPRLSKREQAQARDAFIREGVGAAPVARYQWCGAFAAFAWLAIHPTLRRHLWASTYRLRLFGGYAQDSNLWPDNRVRLVDSTEWPIRKLHEGVAQLRGYARGSVCRTAGIRPGDILCVATATDTPDGGHIVLATEACPPGDPHVAVVSGNGWGERADGSTGGGVVRNLYPREAIRQIIRPSEVDLDPAVHYYGGR